MNIPKSKFIKYMTAIKTAFVEEENKNKALHNLIQDNEEIINAELKNKFISLTIAILKELVNDKENWIEYYIFEKHFGKRTDLKVKTKDDNNEIKLETFEDLYNIIENQSK